MSAQQWQRNFKFDLLTKFPEHQFVKWQNITTPPLSSIVAAGPPTQEERSGENEWGEEDAEKEGLVEEETPIHVTTEAGPATGN